MRLTLQTDYALRLLMHLAIREDQLTTIGQTAEKYAISKNHLMKVANILGRLGYIDTVRGRAGGLKLARVPEKISLGSVVRTLEEETALVDCFPGGTRPCLISPSCRLKGVLAESLNAFYKVLDHYTLNDLVSSNEDLKLALAL